MSDIDFYSKFNFNIFKFEKYHLTDNTQKPIPHHYFGCLVKGTAKIKTQNAELLLKPNEIFYLPKGLTYQSEWFGENIEFYSFGFKISPINKSFILQKITCTAKAQEIFQELCSYAPFTQKGIGALFYFFELVADSMIEIPKARTNSIVEIAIRYMTDYPNLKISDVAKHCNISEPSIYSLFKRQLHKSPNAVRNSILCQKAIFFLTTTNKSVQEISDLLDFSSTSYFRKILKAHTGKTPLEIRKEASII